MLAAKAHADSQGVWHLIRRTSEQDGSHRSYCGRVLAGPDDAWHGSVNGVVGAEGVPVVDRCLRCAKLGRWWDRTGTLF